MFRKAKRAQSLSLNRRLPLDSTVPIVSLAPSTYEKTAAPFPCASLASEYRSAAAQALRGAEPVMLYPLCSPRSAERNKQHDPYLPRRGKCKLPVRKANQPRGSALRELEAPTSATTPRLLPLFHAAIASQQASIAKRLEGRLIVSFQSTSQAQEDRS